MRPKIGIVDDEASMRDALVALLAENQFDPVPMANISEYRESEQSTALDLVLIDLQLRDESGLALAMDIRKSKGLPIVMLSGRGDETDKMVGLEIGADDYLLKPFNPRELVARIRAVLRRAPDKGAVKAKPKPNTFAGWTLNEEQSEITRTDGLVVTLSAGELSILKVFVEHAGEVLSRDDLMQHSRGRDTLAFERTIDNVISRLR